MSERTHTFVFADLAGFTALTEAHGDERAADVALEFCREINRLLPADAEDLKMLGDACLLRVGDATEALELGLRLAGDVSRRHGFLDVRVGMNTGTAAQRGSDWFGSTINISARVAALAGPCDVLLTAATRNAVSTPDGVLFEDCGTHELRHVATPVDLLRARGLDRGGSDDRWVIDPVCRMRLDVDQATTSVERDGSKRFFCSALCAGKFVRSPERYLRDATPARP